MGDARRRHTRKSTQRVKRRLEQVREPRTPQDLARAIFAQADRRGAGEGSIRRL